MCVGGGPAVVVGGGEADSSLEHAVKSKLADRSSTEIMNKTLYFDACHLRLFFIVKNLLSWNICNHSKQHISPAVV